MRTGLYNRFYINLQVTHMDFPGSVSIWSKLQRDTTWHNIENGMHLITCNPGHTCICLARRGDALRTLIKYRIFNVSLQFFCIILIMCDFTIEIQHWTVPIIVLNVQKKLSHNEPIQIAGFHCYCMKKPRIAFVLMEKRFWTSFV